MHKLIRTLGILLLLTTLIGSSRTVSAHALRMDNGYSAVLHMDPDDDPEASEVTVINFLINRTAGGFNQNDYNIKLAISAGGKLLQTSVVEPLGFGNAGDGLVKYTFPQGDTYSLVLSGTSKTDSSNHFKMTFPVRVTGASGSASAAKGRGSQVIALGSSSFVVLGLVGYTTLTRGKRYAATKR